MRAESSMDVRGGRNWRGERLRRLKDGTVGATKGHFQQKRQDVSVVYIMIDIHCDILWYRSGRAMPQTAKLFRNGRSQAVRLPADFRFPGSEVYVRRDPATGDVILSRRPDSWQDFFDLIDTLDIPDDFLSNRRDTPAQKRKLF